MLHKSDYTNVRTSQEDRIDMGSKNSKKELITELHRVAEEVDGTPTSKDMNERGAFSHGPYCSEFGT